MCGVCVEVQESTGYLFRTHRAGSWFGELEMFSGRTRTAGVCAEEICDTLELSSEALNRLFTADPGMAEVKSHAMIFIACLLLNVMHLCKAYALTYRMFWYARNQKL